MHRAGTADEEHYTHALMYPQLAGRDHWFILHSAMGDRVSSQFDRGSTFTELQLDGYFSRGLVGVRTGTGAEAEGVRLDANCFLASLPGRS